MGLVLGLALALLVPASSARAQADSVVVFSSAARTADTSSAILYPPGWARGMLAVWNITAGSGFSAELAVEVILETPSTYGVVYDVGTAQSATGLYCVMVRPGSLTPGTGACLDAYADTPLPRRFRLVVDHADATSVTYDLGVIWLR